jgi:hypothetical protein
MSTMSGSPVTALVTPAGYNSSRYNQPTVASATPTAWTTANSPITLWTVTGTILCRCYGVVGATQITSTGGTGTLAVGVATATGLLLPATTANGTTNFVASAAWVDASPTVLGELLAATQSPYTLVTGNILLTIATNNMTAGAVQLFLDWIPVTAGATVVSGSA